MRALFAAFAALFSLGLGRRGRRLKSAKQAKDNKEGRPPLFGQVCPFLCLFRQIEGQRRRGGPQHLYLCILVDFRHFLPLLVLYIRKQVKRLKRG